MKFLEIYGRYDFLYDIFSFFSSYIIMLHRMLRIKGKS